MKRVFSLLMAVVMVAVLLPLGTVANAEEQEITLSAGDSLADALKNVADGGKIVVDGTVAVTAQPGTHNKTVTITGGNLDFSGLSGNLSLGDHITFENITMTFLAVESGKVPPAIYANGYTVTIGENVTMPNPIRIFGGQSKGTIASTDLTVLSGYYTEIYGGGNNCNITGDVNLYVGGDNVNASNNVNAGIDAFDHGHTHCVYGGGYGSGTIGGTVRTVFTGKAKANYVYGGNFGSNTIAGGVDLTIAGGDVMSVYGGSRGGSLFGNVKLLISGGTMQQVFGGCEGNPMTGDVKLDITGGTITRRVYGGCYNEVSLFGSWDSSYYVDGTITVTLHKDANITYSFTSKGDTSFYARSRYKTANSAEKSHLVYADQAAKDKFEGNLKSFSGYISGVSTADYTHLLPHTYTASGNVITQKCGISGCSCTATLVATGAVYNGTAKETGSVAYSNKENWWGGELTVTYANNVGPGTATASISCGGVTATANFEIDRDTDQKAIMNGVGYATLEEAIAAARQTPEADTIELWGNVEVASHMVFNTEVTLMANEKVTITATDDQTGSMFRVIGGGKLTIQGSKEAPITLVAGKNTTNLVVTNGGEVELINVKMVGNASPSYANSNKARGIFNDGGTITVNSVVIEGMKGDGIYILNDGEVNLEDVTIANTGRYGIKVKGKLNVTNALTISGCGNNAIDIENGGIATGSGNITFANNLKKNIHVRVGGEANLPYDEA